MHPDRHLYKLSLKSLPYLKKMAQDKFNAFIRDRDKDEVCISCGGVLGDVYHAGHFFSVGAFPSVRFDEDNLRAQCLRCNNFLHGNLANYKENLIKKIGIERFNALEQRANITLPRKKLDYIDIILRYKGKK